MLVRSFVWFLHPELETWDGVKHCWILIVKFWSVGAWLTRMTALWWFFSKFSCTIVDCFKEKYIFPRLYLSCWFTLRLPSFKLKVDSITFFIHNIFVSIMLFLKILNNFASLLIGCFISKGREVVGYPSVPMNCDKDNLRPHLVEPPSW